MSMTLAGQQGLWPTCIQSYLPQCYLDLAPDILQKHNSRVSNLGIQHVCLCTNLLVPP